MTPNRRSTSADGYCRRRGSSMSDPPHSLHGPALHTSGRLHRAVAARSGDERATGALPPGGLDGAEPPDALHDRCRDAAAAGSLLRHRGGAPDGGRPSPLRARAPARRRRIRGDGATWPRPRLLRSAPTSSVDIGNVVPPVRERDTPASASRYQRWLRCPHEQNRLAACLRRKRHLDVVVLAAAPALRPHRVAEGVHEDAFSIRPELPWEARAESASARP